jgi:hypothetical protein
MLQLAPEGLNARSAAGCMGDHGVLDLNNFTVTIALKDRVCGDGL